ncbi:MAG TPA: 4-hydroxy-tetrahydrodipicolinate synthase [Clostridia bacterium]|jgi:4-hydroxy-tetrahydrodipicolinate synthase|nr:4-hydroxy-tetrahydrodipicolinate synthase [Clostridia bacterium]
MTIFTGVATALITPMNQDGIDYDSLEKLINFQINNHIDALLTNGTTGEPPTLTDEEKLQLMNTTIEIVNKRVPVIAGAGSNCTAHAVELASSAQKAGADAILAVTPYYNKGTQQGLIEHFKAIADNTKLPIILYNVPSRTGINLLPETVNCLAGYKGICALKEASGNINQILELARIASDKMQIYSGDDSLTYTIMTLGGAGVISVASNIIPEYMHTLTHAVLNGDYDTAKKMQLQALPLINALFCEVNPIPVKCAAKLMGLCSGDYVRLPLTRCSKEELVKKELINFGLIKEV